jgi:small subunit ribosomal protein S6
VNIYENVVIFNVSLAEEALAAAVQKVRDQLTAAGAEVLKVDDWGRRKLAYEINKNSHGHYMLFTFRGPSTAARAIEAFYKVFESVVKQMIVRLEKKQAEHVLNTLKAAQAAQAAAAAAPAVAPVVAEPAAAVEPAAVEGQSAPTV